MKRLPLHFLFVVTAAGVACAAPPSEDPVGSAREAIVNRLSPKIGPDYPSTVVPLGGTGGVSGMASGSDLDTSAGVAHSLKFTAGSDTMLPPTSYDMASSTELNNWVYAATGGDNNQYESSAYFDPRLRQVVTDPSTNVPSRLDKSALDDVKKVLDLLTTTPATVTGPTVDFQGYTPIQARWIKAKYTQTGQSNGVYKRYEYPTPNVVGEVRERGARLYCAARRAMREQAAYPDSKFLGEQVALPLNILGQKIDIGVVQATLTIDGPQRFTGAPNDGAQTFAIPFLAGAHMVPIRGLPLVPDLLPEVRNPIVLMTGDSEVQTAVPAQDITTSYRTVCVSGLCFPYFGKTHDNPEIDHTVTHADAIVSASGSLKWSTTFPIFTVGAFTATMTLGTTVGVGERLGIDNTRLFRDQYKWPLGRSEGTSQFNAAQYFDDSAFSLVSGLRYKADTAMSVVSSDSSYYAAPPDPMLMRWEENDDHHITTRSSLGLEAGVAGDLGFTIGPVGLKFEAKGTLSGHFNLDTHVRDEATVLQAYHSATPPPTRYLTNVTVTPSTDTDLSLKLGLTMEVKMHIPVAGDIDETLTLFDPAPLTKNWGGTPWAEKHRLRLGTGGSGPDPSNATNQPLTVSHLPSNIADASDGTPIIPSFDAFASQSVDACLGDTTPNPMTPPPCKKNPPSTATTPHTNVCAVGHELVGDIGFGNAAQWGTACIDPNGTAAAMAGGATMPFYDCYKKTITFLCSSVSKATSSPVGVSHKLDLSSTTSADSRLGDAITACVNASVGIPPGRVLNSMLEFKMCDDTARPLTADEILSLASPAGPTSPEPVATSTKCY